jgi:acetoacetyl-CoA synthetase
MPETAAPRAIWKPSRKSTADSNLTRFINWLRAERGLEFAEYGDLWEWSVAQLDEFWEAPQS